MEFAGQVATQSSSLHTLHIEDSRTRAEVGDRFVQVLADHHIHWLEHLTISDEKAWFGDGREGCMESLTKLIARQANLKLLSLYGYNRSLRKEIYRLTEEQ